MRWTLVLSFTSESSGVTLYDLIPSLVSSYIIKSTISLAYSPS
jgi:hypothetical protein